MLRMQCALRLALVLAAGCTRAEEDAKVIEVESLTLFEVDSTLIAIRGMAADSAGHLWVLNSREPYLTRYDSTGTIQLQALTRGRGPGEVVTPMGVTSDHGVSSALVVWTPATREIVRIGPDGRVVGRNGVRSVSGTIRSDIMALSHGDPYRILRSSDGFVVASYASGLMRASDFGRGLLVRVDSAHVVLNRIVALADESDSGATDDRRDLVAVPLWAGCDDSTVAVFFPTTRRLLWHSLHGQLRNEVAVASIPRRPLTDGDVEAYLLERARSELGPGTRDPATVPEVQRLIRAAIAQRDELFPAERPAAVRMLCDAQRAVWLQMFGSDGALGYGPEWLVVHPDGQEQRVRVPEGYQPLLVARTRLYGVVVDSLGVQRPATADVPAQLIH